MSRRPSAGFALFVVCNLPIRFRSIDIWHQGRHPLLSDLRGTSLHEEFLAKLQNRAPRDQHRFAPPKWFWRSASLCTKCLVSVGSETAVPINAGFIKPAFHNIFKPKRNFVKRASVGIPRAVRDFIFMWNRDYFCSAIYRLDEINIAFPRVAIVESIYSQSVKWINKKRFLKDELWLELFFWVRLRKGSFKKTNNSRILRMA